jgi:hypothetical protein
MVGAIPGDDKYDTVNTMTTNDPKWGRGESRKMTQITATDDTWQTKWRPNYDPDSSDSNVWLTLDDQYYDSLMTQEIFLTTSDDSIWQYLSPKSKVACLAGEWVQYFEVIKLSLISVWMIWQE